MQYQHYNLILTYILLGLVLSVVSSDAQAQRKSGDILFDDSIVHIVRIRFDQQAFWDSLTYYKQLTEHTTDKVYMQAATVAIDGKSYYSTGVRFKGSSSYHYSTGKKKSFKVKLDKFVRCQAYDGITTFNLNNSFRDPTMMREKLYLDYVRKYEGNAPRSCYAKVFINDEYWGLYLLTEDINKSYLGYHFGNKDGNLYKGEPMAYLTREGRTKGDYKGKYEKQTNKKDDDWRDLINLVNTIHRQDNTEMMFKTQLDPVLNTKSCIRAWAINNFLLNMDSYNMEFQHNFYIYYNTETGRFEWISYDGNYAFAAWYPEEMTLEEALNYPIYATDNKEKSPLAHLLINENETYRDEYTAFMRKFAKSFSDGEIYWSIDRLYKLIKDPVYEDKNKMYTNEEFEKNIEETIYDKHFENYPTPGLRDYLKKRRQHVLEQLGIIN